MSNTLNLNLPILDEGQAQKHVTVNDALRRIDQVVQLAVIDRGRVSPPSNPREGDRYIVGLNPTGAWTGHALGVATYIDGAWDFFNPLEGWLAYSQTENALVYFSGTSWEIMTSSGGGEAVSMLGINTSASTVNRLSVRSRSALFANDPSNASANDVQIVASKGATGGTASHMFQTNFVGRAEFGLIGSDDFSLKVSEDGNSFHDVFIADRATAAVSFSKVPRVGGTVSFGYALPTRASITLARVPADVRRIETRGYAVENDGGEGSYVRVNALPTDGLGIQDAAGGFWSLEGGTVTSRQAGAVGNGTTDDTVALNRALASGRAVLIKAGRYRITNALRTGETFQRISGEGRGRTVISVSPEFNLAAPAVLKLDHSWVTVEDLEIAFDQSSAASRVTLVRYPAAINYSEQTRCRFLRLRFAQAFNGLIGLGNVGGTLMDDIECGSFNIGFHVDGAKDTVIMLNCRVWLYNFAGNSSLENIYSDGQTVGFRIGRCDDLQMTNVTPFRARMIFESNGESRPFGTIKGLSLDGDHSRIEMLDGDLAITSVYCTSSIRNDFCIRQSGGNLVLSDFSFRVGDNANIPLVEVNDATANCQVENGVVELGASVAADAFVVTAGRLSISNVRFRVGSTVNRTGICMRQLGGLLQSVGNTCTRVTTGTGAFLSVATNADHLILGNNSGGWRYEFPSTTTAGLYGPNYDGAGASIANAMRFAPATASSIEGGEIQLDGAGTHNDVIIDNLSGNARISGLSIGISLMVTTGDGTTAVYGNRFELPNQFLVGRGEANEFATTAVGSLALCLTTTGVNNTAVGRRALTSATTASESVAVGTNAGSDAVSGGGNTFVGFSAGTRITGANNTGIGRATFGAITNVTNSTAVGNGATVQGDNEVVLGNSSARTYVYGSLGTRSDARDKADVRNTEFGLSFLMRLRPVDYRWDYREDYLKPADAPSDAAWVAPSPGSRKRVRFHHGFIAQEVAAAAAELGSDFGGYQDHTVAGGADVRSLGYTELLGPIVKAIQEIALRIDALERP